MNLINEYLKTNIKDLLERYYLTGYRTRAELRVWLISEHKFEFVRVRDIPPNYQRLESWEIKANGKTYFYHCDARTKTLSFIGVR